MDARGIYIQTNTKKPQKEKKSRVPSTYYYDAAPTTLVSFYSTSEAYFSYLVARSHCIIRSRLINAQ